MPEKTTEKRCTNTKMSAVYLARKKIFATFATIIQLHTPMGTKEKLIKRFKSQPKDFNWDELVRLFHSLGFELDNKGKTSGSRVIFRNGDMAYVAHKPHPGSIVKGYVMKQILEFLTKNSLL